MEITKRLQKVYKCNLFPTFKHSQREVIHLSNIHGTHNTCNILCNSNAFTLKDTSIALL